MKLTPTLAIVSALGLTGLLTSCVVDPYYPGGSSTTTVTTYRPGYVVNTLPSRYETVTVGGVRYYHHDNVYYRPQGSRYVVVERPHYDNDRYDRRDGDRYDRDRYEDRGRYEDRSRYDDRRGPGYRETTTVIRTLPSGARVVTHRGTRYYESRGVYYQTAPGGYVVVTRPY